MRGSLCTYITISKCLFFPHVGIGISAHAFLLIMQILTLSNQRPKLTNLTVCHLVVIHIVMLLIMVFVESPDLFESLNLRNDIKCKAFFFLSRVMRGFSICTTCLLSVLQAITISPSTSSLVRFKPKSTSHTFHAFFYFWLLNLSISINLIFCTVASSNVTIHNVLMHNKYCSISPMTYVVRSLFFMLLLLRDVTFVGSMLLSSVYMVLLLFRHQRRAQHLHRTSLSPRPSPEKRATQTILLPVSFFVVMYGVDFIISSSSTLIWVYDPVILGVQRLVVNAYATVSPLVLISSDKRIIIMMQAMQQKFNKLLAS